jgi:hypothetical protein
MGMQDQFNYQQQNYQQQKKFNQVYHSSIYELKLNPDKNKMYNIHKTILTEPEKKRSLFPMLRKEGREMYCPVIVYRRC